LTTQLPASHRAAAPRSFQAVGIRYARTTVSSWDASCESTKTAATHGRCQRAIRLKRDDGVRFPLGARCQAFAEPTINRDLTICGRLNPVELSVLSALRHQGIVRAGLDNPSTIEDDDQIRHSHCRETV
jgi:hypothetical protein